MFEKSASGTRNVPCIGVRHAFQKFSREIEIIKIPLVSRPARRNLHDYARRRRWRKKRKKRRKCSVPGWKVNTTGLAIYFANAAVTNPSVDDAKLLRTKKEGRYSRLRDREKEKSARYLSPRCNRMHFAGCSSVYAFQLWKLRISVIARENQLVFNAERRRVTLLFFFRYSLRPLALGILPWLIQRAFYSSLLLNSNYFLFTAMSSW